MAGRRPPPDRETAPGDEPGAESFARGIRGEPQGIVRLSDLFAAADFETSASAAEGSSGSRTSAGAAAGARTPRSGRPPATPTGDAEPHRTARRGAGLGERPAQRLPTGESSAAAHARGTARRNRRAASDDAAAWSGRPAGRTIAGAPEASEPEIRDPGDNGGEGPAYESLFDTPAGESGRAKRRRPPATALQRALGLLTRREHSRRELTRKLVSRGVDAAEVETAVDKLTSAGWQDDGRFAESVVRSRASNGYGPLHIRAELGTHGLPEGVAEAAMEAFEGDWAAIARDLAVRRFARIEDPRLRARKAADFLMRRGFPGDVVRAAVRFDPED